MKKRQALILSVVLLITGLVMLVGISFAWFSASMQVKTGAFDVKIASTVSLKVDFLRKYSATGNYVSVLPQNSFIGGVNNEMMIPGEPLYCRIDITNQSTSTATVSTQFYNITYKIEGTESAETFINELKSDFVILFATDIVNTSTPTQPTAPTEPTDNVFEANRLNFLNGSIGESTDGGLTYPTIGGDIALFKDISIPANSTLSFYYRYLLTSNFTGFDGHTFSMSSGGILISG